MSDTVITTYYSTTQLLNYVLTINGVIIMKRFVWAAIFILLSVLLILKPAISMNKETGTESECISCHTNLKDLMRLCWKIEKMRPKQAASEETSGEG